MSALRRLLLAGVALPLPALAQGAGSMWQSANAAAAWVALIGTAVTFVGTIIGLVWNARTGRRLEADRVKAASELARLNNELSRAAAREKTELDARTKYEFDARQRLYQQIEPVLFQLREAVRAQATQCASLARTARKSRTRKPDEEDELRWLDHAGDSYYLRITAFRLLRPLALLRLMQDRITSVDLRLDPRIRRIYALAGLLRDTCRDPWKLGAEALAYAPDYESAAPSTPATALQHIVGGELDHATDALVTDATKDTPARLLRFGEFDRALTAGDERAEAVAPLLALLRDMRHGPDARPVAWRMVVAQGLIARLIEAGFAARDADAPFEAEAAFAKLRAEDLDWGDTPALRAAREATAAYLRRWLEENP